jgi:hypothetical protein
VGDRGAAELDVGAVEGQSWGSGRM